MPEWELIRLPDLAEVTLAWPGGSGEEVSTHLEEIWRHLPLHQVALDMLGGTFREGLGKTEMAVNSPRGPFIPSQCPGHSGPAGRSGHSRASRPAAPS